MKTSTKVAIGAAAALGAGLLITAVTLDDEAPIRVRGGSIHIEAEPYEEREWRWEREEASGSVASAYSHEPVGTVWDWFEGELVVRVRIDTGAVCDNNATKFRGRQVQIEYTTPSTGGTFNATLQRGKSGVLNYRIKVRPDGDFTLTGTTLVSTATGGYISRLRVTGGGTSQGSCTFPSASALQSIDICSSDGPTACH